MEENWTNILKKTVENHRELGKKLSKMSIVQKIDQKSQQNVENWIKIDLKYKENPRRYDKILIGMDKKVQKIEQ